MHVRLHGGVGWLVGGWQPGGVVCVTEHVKYEYRKVGNDCLVVVLKSRGRECSFKIDFKRYLCNIE